MMFLVCKTQTTWLVKKIIPELRSIFLFSSNQLYLSSSTKTIKYIPDFKNKSLPDYRNTPFGSQYSPLSPVQITEEKIKEYLTENSPETFDDWDEAKNYFYSELTVISDVNYSSIIMNSLLNMNNIKLAQSFMSYLQDSNIKPNILAYLQYIALCGKNVSYCGQEEIYKILEKIQPYMDCTPVFDMKRTLYIIQGLCGTDKWRSAFDFLQKIPFSPSLEIRNILASTAIRNGDEALAWEIVTRRFKKNEPLFNQVVEDFLKHAISLLSQDRTKAVSFLLKFFNHIVNTNIVLNEKAAKLVEVFFISHSSVWNITYTKVNRCGYCNFCRKSMKPAELSDREFTHLKNSFLEKSVKKQDIFINTTEGEFSKYITFIERHKPFHIVIDGLNAAHTLKTMHRSTKHLANHLLQIVLRLSSKSRRVLVLGRKHMVSWPQYIMDKIAHRSTIFLTNNSSQDDPFTVYAALASGPNTFILTMDLMRDHISRLDDPNLIALFKRWQLSHQVLLNFDEKNDFTFTEPVRHSIRIQGDMESGWHIPYDDEIEREPYEELNSWLCIRK